MDMINSKRLLDFCKEYKSIICYGASEHGYTVKHYLELNGIRVCAFMISDDVAKEEYRDGIPVHSVKNVKKIGGDVGIVLSLYERHHDAVIAGLCENGRTGNIYPISDEEQIIIRQAVLILERHNTLTKCDFTEDEKLTLEKQARTFLGRYKKIECRFMDVFRIGAYAMWRYFCWLREQSQDNIFYLYYPIAHQHHKNEKLKGANGFLLGKLQGDGIECISERNLSFWQYMYSFHKSVFTMIDDYEFANYTEDIVRNLKRTPVDENLVSLDADEVDKGRKLCNLLGLKSKYVCISNRDVIFLHTMMRDTIKMDFRDSYRNSSIENFFEAVDYLNGRSIQTVRMGSMVEKSWKYPNVIDYASSGYWSEFLDVYLTGNCKFFVSDLSGIMAFAILMARPMLLLNAALLTTRYDAPVFISPERDVALLKKLWDKKNNRYLTIRDMLNFEVNICRQEKNIAGAVYGEYHRREIVPVDNTPEEILAAVQEMNERIDGTIQYDDLDIELQERYREIVDNYPMRDNVLNNWRLGAKFLRDNQWLLE